MKTPAVLLWFLATLLLCGLTGWEAYRKGKESLGREQMMDIIEDMGETKTPHHAHTKRREVYLEGRPGKKPEKLEHVTGMFRAENHRLRYGRRGDQDVLQGRHRGLPGN